MLSSLTVLQPPAFMQNVNLGVTLASSSIPAAYSPKTLQGFLDLNDLAEVAAKVILDPEPHNRATYDLTGENSTLEDVARELSAHLGKEIAINRVPAHVALEQGLARMKLSNSWSVDALDRMLFYCDRQ